MTIRLLQPNMPPAGAVLSYLRKIDDNRWYTNGGPLVQELEAALSQHYGGAHVVTVANCTLGLELAWMRAAARGATYARMPSLTFPASATAALRAGLSLHLSDVDPLTFTATGVSGFGYPQSGAILDAAGAWGEQKVPRETTAVFSLHATKPLGAGEGGYIVTWDAQEAADYRRMANFGLQEGVCLSIGTNAKMSEYAAAVALAALRRWDRAPWLRLYDWYAEHLPPSCQPQWRPRGVYSLMPVKLPVPAQGVLERLRAEGVESRRYYCPPVHRTPLYSGTPLSLPVTDHLAEHLLCLPYHSHLSEPDVVRVCDALARAVRGSKPRKTLLVREEERARA